MGFCKSYSAVALMLFLCSASGFANPASDFRVIETSSDFAKTLLSERPEAIQLLGSFSPNTVQLRVDSDVVDWISGRFHALMGRCGGFMDVTDEVHQAPAALAALPTGEKPAADTWPVLGEKDTGIVEAIGAIQPKNIEDFSKSFSAKFDTRKAGTSSGEEAPKWLQNEWQKLAKEAARTDVVVELLPGPKNYNQQSVRITIPGTDPTAPVVVLGGHLDSINSAFFGPTTAPGADDDASGIAALTEIYRMLLKRTEKLKATVEIFGYAAEEVGLLGSRVIAEDYSKKKRAVRAVMQLDMVAWPSEKKKVTFIRDFTDDGLTTWTEQLFGLYVGLEYQEEKCNYGCSDHASWTRYNYKSVMPFESSYKEMNNRIHSEYDIWDSLLDADYAALFAKLGYAFTVTLAK